MWMPCNDELNRLFLKKNKGFEKKIFFFQFFLYQAFGRSATIVLSPNMSAATLHNGLMFVTERGELVSSGVYALRETPLFTSTPKYPLLNSTVRYQTSAFKYDKHLCVFQYDLTGNKLPKFVFVAGCNKRCLMVAEDGSLWAVGDMRNGAAGFDSTAHTFLDSTNPSVELEINIAAEPLRVPTSLFQTAKISVLSCGLDHTLALDTSGRVFASGGNQNGQCGTNSVDLVVAFTAVKYAVEIVEPVDVNRYEMVQGITAVKISAGGTHSMILAEDKDGQMAAWRAGNGYHGRIGTLGYDQLMFTKMNHFDDMCVLDVECGFSHTGFIVCERSVNGEQKMRDIMMCGDNYHSQLGGFSNDVAVYWPGKIDGAWFEGKKIERIALGRYVSFAVVQTDDGFHQLYGWGSAHHGGMAVKDNTTRVYPHQILASRSACTNVQIASVENGFSTTTVVYKDGVIEIFGAKHVTKGLDFTTYDASKLVRNISNDKLSKLTGNDSNRIGVVHNNILQHEKQLALAMAYHPRLGSSDENSISMLEVDVMRQICSMVQEKMLPKPTVAAARVFGLSKQELAEWD
jgi:alpha-tubulin suppressor-like RCC1 family protein